MNCFRIILVNFAELLTFINLLIRNNESFLHHFSEFYEIIIHYEFYYVLYYIIVNFIL